MGSVNKVILVGFLGQKPEVRRTGTGRAVAHFSLATHEAWLDAQGAKQERTDWHRVVAWGALAELCGEYLADGRQVYVEGQLQTREWNDAEGKRHSTTEVVAADVLFLRDGGGAGRVPKATEAAVADGAATDEAEA